MTAAAAKESFILFLLAVLGLLVIVFFILRFLYRHVICPMADAQERYEIKRKMELVEKYKDELDSISDEDAKRLAKLHLLMKDDPEFQD